MTKFYEIESNGISLLKDNIENTRNEAINNALKKALIKTIKKFVSNYNSEKIEEILINPKDFVVGYEILKEKLVGNIFNEKLKVIVNLNLLLKKLSKENYSSKVIYIITSCFQKIDNETMLIYPQCNAFLKNNLSENNLIIKDINEDYERLFRYSKDILLISSLTIKNKRKIFSINKQFADVSMIISIYDDKNFLINKYEKNFKIILPINNEPVKFFPKNLLNDIKKFIKSYTKQKFLTKQEKNYPKIILIAKNITNYSEIKKLEKILNKYNISKKLIIIKDNSFIYEINNKELKDIFKILKFSKIDYKFIKTENDNLTISF